MGSVFNLSSYDFIIDSDYLLEVVRMIFVL